MNFLEIFERVRPWVRKQSIGFWDDPDPDLGIFVYEYIN